MSADQDAAAAELPGDTFEFQHKLFHSSEEACFRRAADGSKEPVFVLKIDENEFVLPFDGIRREFGIEEESADARMLELVCEALHFVRTIKPGDPIPQEMITGEASWEITDEHRRTAHQRINVQLAHWMTGDGELITDPDQLQQIAEDPVTRKQVREALDEAAVQLNLGENGKEILLDRIEHLTEDLAGIEALRDYLDRIKLMRDKIEVLRRKFGAEMSVLEIAQPVAQLLNIAMTEFHDAFELLDCQTGEIMAVLNHLDTQTKFIRENRDELHQKLVDWDEMIEMWGPARVIANDDSVNLLKHTYRFLAPRFMQVDQWDLQSKAQEGGGKKIDAA